jgi:hypothetical protein
MVAEVELESAWRPQMQRLAFSRNCSACVYPEDIVRKWQALRLTWLARETERSMIRIFAQISCDTHDTRLNLAIAVKPRRPGIT